MMAYIGEGAALLAAMLWAITSVIWSRVGSELSPVALNFFKACVGLVFLGGTLAIFQTPFPVLTLTIFILLGISGILGIALGDTCYFETLNALGPRRALLLDALGPCFSALLALVFLQEQLTAAKWLGIGLTIGGVTWVLSERTPQGEQDEIKNMGRGIVFGLLTAMITASGAVLSRAALLQNDLDPLWSAFLRLGAAWLVLLPWWWWQGAVFKPTPRLTTIVFSTAFAGTYLGIWLQQTAFKYTNVGVGQALSATSPLFILPLDLLQGKTISWRTLIGVLVAILGVMLLLIPI